MPRGSAGDPAPAPRGRIVRAESVRTWQEAADLLAAARAEAAEIVARAQREGERLFEHAREEAELEAAVLVAERLAAGTAALDGFLAGIELHLADLVVDQVVRIIGARDERDTMIGAALTALRESRHARRMTVRVPQADVDWIESGLMRELEPQLRDLLVIQPDPHMAHGRCVISSEFGFVEAGIAEQIAAVRRGLRGEPEATLDG